MIPNRTEPKGLDPILAIIRVGGVPAPSDIISGREFLSILMKPTGGATTAAPHQARNFRGLRKFHHTFYDHELTADDDTILPIEALFTSREDLDRSSTRFYGQRESARVSTSTVQAPTSEAVDEVTVAGELTTMSTPGDSTEQTEQTTVGEDVGAITTIVGETSVSEEEVGTVVPAVVRPSGRYAKRAKAIQQQPVEYAKVAPTARHSNAHRSELSVEERGPMISKEDEPDSARGESSAVAKLVVAPSPSTTPQRYRTQRKQEPNAGPTFQAVTYHDRKTWKDPNGDGEPKMPKNAAPMYSEPARYYSEPAQFYSEPARVYSEPAKVYSEPAKVYSEPAKVYSEPAKVYSQPSSYWQTVYSGHESTTAAGTATVTPTTTLGPPPSPTTSPPSTESPASHGTASTASIRLVFNELDKIPYDQLNAPTVDGGDADSIHNAIGKFVPKQTHPAPDQPVVQTLAPVLGTGDGDSKVGYVVEGRNYRKYRVEEKTPDGFIVGEYGVLSHNDGNLRGVRYTADSDINPRLIYDALLKFLSL
uniref:Uncharacterized protein n=1 Tax=Anopheles farauti TaxID=69004 RepID=A0A182Q158_9DIPT